MERNLENVLPEVVGLIEEGTTKIEYNDVIGVDVDLLYDVSAYRVGNVIRIDLKKK